jgi:predicted RNA-binding Zn-ribbon protein involved in translation (DUF1610 family)
MVAEQAWSQRAAGMYGTCIGLGMVGTNAIAQLILPVPAAWPPWVGSTVLALLAGVLAWPVYTPVSWCVRRGMALSLRAAYLKESRCASCGYSLAGISEDSSEIVRCPECGAGWSLRSTAEAKVG